MNSALLFGTIATDTEAAKSQVEQALGIALERHESDYFGGDYFRGESGPIEVVVRVNFVEEDGDATEPDFPGGCVLVYVSGDTPVVEIAAHRLTERGLRLLRSRTY